MLRAKSALLRAELDGRGRARIGGAAQGPTWPQWLAGGIVTTGLAALLAWTPMRLLHAVHAAFYLIFSASVLWRCAALATPQRRRRAGPIADAEPPRYTVIAPMFDEAEVASQLLANLARLDYPADRLQVLVVLEAADAATRAAVLAAAPAANVEVVVAPPAAVQTKPRACNLALARATGEFVVIYDAEDGPRPGQLREAAARFASAPPSLACLQAPLRISTSGLNLFQRQFALEYAALFEVMLPAYARWGLPFPLGGTSNHFRRCALEAVGGWDAYNVTEDADLGLRLARFGYRSGVLRLPTWETPPDFDAWLPQRARWVKGYMQTWGVHMRAPWRGGLRSAAALQATLGMSILSAVWHGPLALGVIATVIVAVSHLPGPMPLPEIAPEDAGLCLLGWLAAVTCMAVGARRAGTSLRLTDALFAPVYWPMQSLAAGFAVRQLVLRPFHWDKTRHRQGASNAAAAGPAVSGPAVTGRR